MSVSRYKDKRASGFRCDWCGKFANNANGEYVRPNGHAGYIHAPDWDKEGPFDICEECAEQLCPRCGCCDVVMMTPTVCGSMGWGARCKRCGENWALTMMEHTEEPAKGRGKR